MLSKRGSALLMAIIILTFLFGSMFLAILAFQDIPKYNRPYLFTITVATIGSLLGFALWRKVKPYIWKYAIYKPDNSTASVIIIMSVIGTLLFLANRLNIISSNKTGCDTFVIIDKYREKGRSRKPEVNTLVVKLPDRAENIVCNFDYWIYKNVGDKIHLCFHKSSIGFDYIEIDKDWERRILLHPEKKPFNMLLQAN